MLNYEPTNIIIQNMKFQMINIIMEGILHTGIVISPSIKPKSFYYLTGNIDKKSRTFVAIHRKFWKKGRPGAEGPACADPGARTPIGVSGNTL